MLKQKLQQKLLQKLSPQQIQMIKLLEIPTIQLEQRIKKELEENPVLEEGHEDEPETNEEEALAEVQAAQVQVKKPEPDKPKIANRLKGAVAALKGMAEVGTQAVAIGNMIGKAILWCGEQWTPWIS